MVGALVVQEVVKWLLENRVIEQILVQKDPGDTPLTASSARALLDGYVNRLQERMDEERIRQLAGALSQVRDSTRSAAPSGLLEHALDSFHEIIALPDPGTTGTFRNAELRSLAFLGMAAAYQLRDDRTDLIAEKLVRAVDADFETSKQFLGEDICNSIRSFFWPSQFFQLAGPLENPDALFPADCLYLAPTGVRTISGEVVSAHLWVRQENNPITGAPSYVVGLTRYSAQVLVDAFVWDRINLPEQGSKVRQMKQCGKLGFALQDLPLSAPLSGTVAAVNRIYGKPKLLAQDPYGEGWLFHILPDIYRNRDRLNREIASLKSADAYRDLISSERTRGTVSVDSIAYTSEGGRNSDRDLLISVALVDHLGNPVPNATIVVEVLFGEEETPKEFRGSSGMDGAATLVIRDARPGRYSTRVREVEAAELWLCRAASPDNEFYR